MPTPKPPTSLDPNPRIDFTAVPSNIEVTGERVNQLNARAAETAAAFKQKIESLQSIFADARDRFSREADSLVDSADAENRDVAQKFALQRKAQQVVSSRRTLIESSADDRAAMLQQLKSFADEAAAIEKVCATPTQMLARCALGDPKKTQLIQQLVNAGTIELETAARLAIYANDVILASAVVVVVDRLQRDRRPFAAHDFALRFWGSQYEDASVKLHAVQRAYNAAKQADLAFIRNDGVNSVLSLSAAIAGGALDAHVQDVRGVAHVTRPTRRAN